MAGPYNPPLRNSAFTTYVSLWDMASPGTYRVNPTLAAGDVKVSKDGGAFSNVNGDGSGLLVVAPAGSQMVGLPLVASEMDADNVVIQFVDQTSPKEWADLIIVIVTTDGLNPPIRGNAFETYLALWDFSNPGSYKANPTLAVGDVQVSKDGANFANIDAGGTNIPSLSPAASRMIKLSLTATEMTADLVVVRFVDQTNPKEWADMIVTIVTAT